MTVDVLIDGYNLLHAAGLARKRYGPGELQRRRATLLQKLASLMDPAVQARTTVVFDSQRETVNDAPGTTSSMKVVFSTAPLEADDLIEQMLKSHSSPRQVLVVSSDHRLHKAARRRGATPVDSDVFLDQLEGEPESGGATRGRRSTPRAKQNDPAVDEDLLSSAAQELDRLARPERDDRSDDLSRPALGELDDPGFWEERIRGPKRPPKS